MYSVGAFLYDPYDLSESHLSGIVNLQSATGNETKIEQSKNDGIKNRLVSLVKRTIYENVVVLQTDAFSVRGKASPNHACDGLFYSIGAKVALAGWFLHEGNAVIEYQAY